jgi:GNAT superfamily N-acetyltransferase
MKIHSAVRLVEELTPDEKLRTSEIDHIAFSGTEDDSGVQTWATSHWLMLGYADDLLVSIVGVLVRDVRVGDQTVRLGGIGGVATLPEWRRMGLAGALLDESAGFMRDTLQVDFGFLICSEAKKPFYGRHGWIEMKAPVVFDQPGGKMSLNDTAMILPALKSSWPPGPVDLCGLPW